MTGFNLHEKSLGSFSSYVHRVANGGDIVVQPRMGFSCPDLMKSGLLNVKQTDATTIGTITLDSFTRQKDYHAVSASLAAGVHLNGYPIVNHGVETTSQIVAVLLDDDFQIQVRHGTSLPDDIFRVMLASGITATEGGPISYCLPYSRTPLSHSVAAWRKSCELLANHPEIVHLESFGGCMLGQLSPPSMLIAVGLLESFLVTCCGIKSLSLSYTQGISFTQDLAALSVLRSLADELLKDIDWHVVVYTYMGLFPETIAGAKQIIADSAKLVKEAGCERLIVKTISESKRLPTINENIQALEHAHRIAKQHTVKQHRYDQEEYQQIYTEVMLIIDCVMNLHTDIGQAILCAFERGYIDIPYCLHQDNQNKVRSSIDYSNGYLRWVDCGDLPFPKTFKLQISQQKDRVDSDEFLGMLKYMRWRYDSHISYK